MRVHSHGWSWEWGVMDMKLGPMKGERGGVLVNEGPLTWVVLGMRCYGHEVGTDEGGKGRSTS